MFVCTGCKKEYDSPTKFCGDCGGKVEEVKEQAPQQEVKTYVCSGCKKKFDAPTNFCGDCGGKVEEVKEQAPQQEPAAQPAQEVKTYVCSDCQKKYNAPIQTCGDCGGKVEEQVQGKTVQNNTTSNFISGILAIAVGIGVFIFVKYKDDWFGSGKAEKAITSLCVKTFKTNPHKITAKDKNVYEVYVNKGDTEPICFTYNKSEKKIHFASTKDENNWIDKRMVPLIKKRIKEIFDRDAYRVKVTKSLSYEIIVCNPKSKKVPVYLTSKVKMNYDKSKKKLVFASEEDESAWKEMKETYKAFKTSKSDEELAESDDEDDEE